MRGMYFTQYQGCSSFFFPGNSFLLLLSITSIRPYLVQILTYRSNAYRNFSNINHFPRLLAQSPGKKLIYFFVCYINRFCCSKKEIFTKWYLKQLSLIDARTDRQIDRLLITHSDQKRFFFGDPGVMNQENKVSIDGKLLCL